jgi:hypothetical protein
MFHTRSAVGWDTQFHVLKTNARRGGNGIEDTAKFADCERHAELPSGGMFSDKELSRREFGKTRVRGQTKTASSFLSLPLRTSLNVPLAGFGHHTSPAKKA